jgi:MYXO-CTERM domain-containing protein
MKTFLKILLFGLLAVVVIHVFPLLLVPATLSVVVMLGLGVLLVGVLAALLAVALVVLTVLSPLWLPLLAVFGLVSLCRRRPVAA